MIDLDDLEDLFDDLSIDGPNPQQLFQMYGIYLSDIVNNSLTFNGKTVKFNNSKSNHPICKGKHKAFEHIITRESKYSGKRNFDAERANKIHWIKPIIENAADYRIKYFEAINDKNENQHFFWYEEMGFIVILRDINPDLLLITSFSVDSYEKGNYKKLYEDYSRK
jgi:hypothetical protein